MSTPTTTGTGPRTIDAAALKETLASGQVRVLDVRTPAEFETMHIPGAYNVPPDTLREHHEELERQARLVAGSMVLSTTSTTAPARS